MKEMPPFAQTFAQLPNSLAIFPLNGAVVLPRGSLALNIFETRYLKMVQDAMKSSQLIGMIQTKEELKPPSLYEVGCAGRIVRYTETTDGRLEILLRGLCRFSIDEELSCMRGYRVVKPNWQKFQCDYADCGTVDAQYVSSFMQALRNYFARNNIEIDWSTVSSVSEEVLVNELIGQLALSNEDKQLLIEASTLEDRLKSFTAILTEAEEGLITRH